jgi:NADH:ubiquinone oxidoreductase subunit 6 (subunit J)
MGDYVVALIAIGVLLTAALVGAAVIAMEDKKS